MTSIQYINNSSLLIDNGNSLLLTNPWYNLAYGEWLPSAQVFHPAYLTSLARQNKENFSILLSSKDQDFFDQNYLQLFDEDIDIIVPKENFSFFKNYLNSLGFVNVYEIEHRLKIQENKFKQHENSIISIETPDAFIVHSPKSNTFTEECMHSIDLHMQDYKQRSLHVNDQNDKIILAAPINTSNGNYPNFNYDNYTEEVLRQRVNTLYIQAINMKMKYMFFYAGDDNFNTVDKESIQFKDYNYYKSLVKDHLVDKLEYIDLPQGYKFDFNTITGIFGKYNYNEKTLKDNFINFYKNEFPRRR